MQPFSLFLESSDEVALAKAVLSSTHDLLPALVYADWLDEHGRENDAKLLRLACSPKPPTRPGRIPAEDDFYQLLYLCRPLGDGITCDDQLNNPVYNGVTYAPAGGYVFVADKPHRPADLDLPDRVWFAIVTKWAEQMHNALTYNNYPNNVVDNVTGNQLHHLRWRLVRLVQRQTPSDELAGQIGMVLKAMEPLVAALKGHEMHRGNAGAALAALRHELLPAIIRGYAGSYPELATAARELRARTPGRE